MSFTWRLRWHCKSSRLKERIPRFCPLRNSLHMCCFERIAHFDEAPPCFTKRRLLHFYFEAYPRADFWICITLVLLARLRHLNKSLAVLANVFDRNTPDIYVVKHQMA